MSFLPILLFVDEKYAYSPDAGMLYFVSDPELFIGSPKFSGSDHLVHESSNLCTTKISSDP